MQFPLPSSAFAFCGFPSNKVFSSSSCDLRILSCSLPYKFRVKELLGPSVFDHDLGHLSCGIRVHKSGHSDLGILSRLRASSIFTSVYADTASAACPSRPCSRPMTSITSAAVICDAHEPCSVNTAYAPASSFTMSHEVRLDLVLLECLYQFGVFEVTKSPSMLQSGHCSCFSVLPENPLSCSWPCSASKLELSRACPIFRNAAFASGIFPRFLQENEFVHRIVMVHRSLSFRCDVVFVTSSKSSFRSLSCGFMRLHHTSVLYLDNFAGCFKPCYKSLNAISCLDSSSCKAWPLRHAPPTSYLHSWWSFHILFLLDQ